MQEAFTGVRRHFASLEECVGFLESGGLPAPEGLADGAPPGDLPALLYRGEPSAYGSTLPSIVRTLRSTRDSAVKELLIDLEGDLLWEFGDEFGGTTLGFSQHYGMPTDYVEFTSSLRVAAFFASGGPEGDAGPGLIGVLDVVRALRHCSILDLSGHPRAPRPTRQHAFAVRQCGRNLCDYKDPVCCERLGLSWYAFGRQAGDADHFRGAESVTDAREDALAAWMRERVRTYRTRPDARRPEVDRVLCSIEVLTS